MSFVGGTSSSAGTPISAIMVSIGADVSPAVAAAGSVGQATVDAGQQASSKSTPLFQQWSQGIINAAQSATATLSRISMAFGGESPLQPLVQGLQAASIGLSQAGGFADAFKGKLDAVKAAGTGLSVVSGVILGIGAALTAISAPAQRANADLATALANVKNGGDVTNETIKNLVKTGQQYGFTQDQVKESLARVTVATQNATEAVKEQQLVEVIAAATHRSLAQAARQVDSMHAGLFRSLRQFGIQVNTVKGAADALKAAEDALAKATEQLQAVQQRQTDLEARLAQQKSDAQAQWAEKVQAANQKAADAEQNYATLDQEQTDRMTTQRQQYADAVQTAADAVAQAQSNLADLQARQAAEELDRVASLQEAQENAAQSTEDAQTRLAQLQQRLRVAGPAKNAQEELQRQQELTNAQDAVTKAQEKQADADSKSVDSATQKVDSAQQLTKAQDQVVKSNDALQVAQQKQADHDQETLQMQTQLARAYESMTAAQAKAAQTQAQARTAGDPSLAQQQQLDSLNREVKAKQDAVAQDTSHVSDLKAGVNAVETEFQKDMADMLNREQGFLDRRKKTWAGHMAEWKAMVTNMAQDAGKFAEPLIAIGAGGSIIGRLVAGAGQIKNFSDKLRGIKDAATEGAKGATEIAKVSKAASEVAPAAEEGVSVLPGIMETLGPLLMGPVGIIIGVIALIAIAGYEIVTHWKTIKKWLGEAWDGIKEAASAVWQAIQQMFHRVVDDTVNIFLHWTLIGIIINHWHDITRIFREGVDGVVNFFTKLPGRVIDAFVDFHKDMLNAGLNVVQGLWQGITDAGGWLMDRIKSFISDHILGPFKSILHLHSPSEVTAEMGGNIIQGLVQGMQGEQGSMRASAGTMGQQIADALIAALTKRLEGIPNDMLTVGHNIVVGIWNGLVAMQDWFVGQLEGLIKSIIPDPIRRILGIFSPSRVMAEMGREVPAGLAQGIKGNTSAVSDAVRQMTGAVLGPVSSGTLAQMAAAQSRASLTGLGGNVPSPTPAGVGGQVVNNYYKAEVAGSVMGQQEFFTKFRDWVKRSGAQNGGGFFNGQG